MICSQYEVNAPIVYSWAYNCYIKRDVGCSDSEGQMNIEIFFEDVFVNSSNKDTRCALQIILSSNRGRREALQSCIHFCLC